MLDAAGCVVSPGLVDLHVHLREPGDEEAETIETGARAAALGGFTAVVAMPNTDPPLDDAAVVQRRSSPAGAAAGAVRSACRRAASPSGARASELAPMGELYDARRPHLHRRRRLRRRRQRDAAGARVRGVVAGRGGRAARRGRDARRAVGTCTKGEWSSRLGIPGRPAVAETVIVARDLELARLTGAPRTLPPLLDRGRRRPRARRPRRAGLPVTAEVAPHHFALTDACARAFDPMFKVNPPLRIRRRRRGHPARDSPTAPSTPSPPIMRRTRRRRRSARSRRRRRACSGLETALAVTITELVEPGILELEDALALLSWQAGAAIAGLAGQGRPGRAGQPRQPRACSTPRTSGRSTPTAREPGPEHAVRRPHAHAAGCRTRVLARRPGRDRRGGDPMSDRRASWCSATARVRGRGDRRRRRRRRRRDRRGACSTPRSRATRRSSPTRRYAGQIITFTYPHIGNYGVNADDDESRRPFCAGVVVRDLARRHSNWRADEPVSTPSSSATACPASPASTPAASPVTCATPARCPARSAPTRPRCAPRRAPRAGTDGIDLVAGGHHRRALHRRRRGRAVPRRRLRLRDQAHDPAPPGRRRAAASTSCRRRRPRPRCSPATPTASSCRTAPATPPRSSARPTPSRGAGGRGPGLRHLPRSPDPRLGARAATPTSCRSATTAATTRSATSRPGRVEITSQNHNYAVDADALGRPGRAHPREPQRRRGRGLPGARTRRCSACSTIPRPGPDRTTPAYLFDEFTTLMAEAAARTMPQAAPTSRRSSSSAAARS